MTVRDIPAKMELSDAKHETRNVAEDNQKSESETTTVRQTSRNSPPSTKLSFSIRDIIGEDNSSRKSTTALPDSSQDDKSDSETDDGVIAHDRHDTEQSTSVSESRGSRSMIPLIHTPMFSSVPAYPFQGVLSPFAESRPQGGHSAYHSSMGPSQGWMYHDLIQRNLWLEGAWT